MEYNNRMVYMYGRIHLKTLGQRAPAQKNETTNVKLEHEIATVMMEGRTETRAGALDYMMDRTSDYAGTAATAESIRKGIMKYSMPQPLQ